MVSRTHARRKARPRAGLGLIALVLVTMAATAAACSSPLNRQPRGSPIPFPYTVGEVPPLKFEMDRQGDEIRYQVICRGTGQWQVIQLDVTTATTRNRSAIGGPIAYDCESAPNPVFTGSLLRLQDLTPGEQVDIYFDVTLAVDAVAKTGSSFIVGPDRALYRADAARSYGTAMCGPGIGRGWPTTAGVPEGATLRIQTARPGRNA